jgi:cysteinyl-tRNA synthetase
MQTLARKAATGDIIAKKRLAKAMNWLGLYRPTFHHAYQERSMTGRGTGGRKAPSVALLSKYATANANAHALVLNTYNLSTDVSERQQSRQQTELLINTLDSNLQEDNVAFELSEHCLVALVAISPDAERGIDFENQVQSLVDQRLDARKRRDFKESDRIRDDLAAMGVVLKDAKDPASGEIVTTWEVKS